MPGSLVDDSWAAFPKRSVPGTKERPLDASTVATWLGIVVTTGGALAGAVKFAFWTFDEWQKRRTHEGFSAPTDTLRFALQPEGSCWWSMGKRGDEPIMQIVGRAFATNISRVPVRIPQIELRHGFLGRRRTAGMVMVRHPEENIYGFYDIGPGDTTNVSFDFWVYPPVVEAIQPFTAHSVVFFDQFGNRHRIKGVRFRSLAADSRPKPKEPEEFPYQITDAIEKEVVSVLRAELGRYQICGRSVGGLGSVHLVYQDSQHTGVGGDSWKPDSPINQVIANDPDSASIESDNLDALSALYRKLASDDERARFSKALLDRLHPDKGYLAVSYFIVAALIRAGFLAEALRKARRDLPTGEQRVFGLSNVLMLLNGMLRYRHPDLTSEDLDEIERMIHGLDEHPFLIPTKIAAIRANRLAASKRATDAPA
jgi:hypothetical protein